MGRTPAARQPTKLKLLRGERHRDRLNLDEPQPPAGELIRPDWLSPAAAGLWDEVVPSLAAMGVAAPVDVTALAAFVESYARWRRARDVVAEHGLTMTGRDGNEVKRPEVAMMRDAAAELRLWCREFGLTPSARSELHAASARPTSPDPRRFLTPPV